MKRVVAREIMTSPVITATPETPFREIAMLMLHHRVSGLPVVDDSGRLLGIISEADLIRKEEQPLPQPTIVGWHGRSLWLERLVDRHQKATGMTARDLMTENVVTATEETKAHELAHLMLARGVNRIPIVREGRVVGIVTRADILKVFVRTDTALAASITQALLHDLWIDPSALAITCTNGVVAIAGQVDRQSDKEFIIKWVKSVDGVVGLNADGLTYRIDDLALGKVTV